jgi:hypothetical protein
LSFNADPELAALRQSWKTKLRHHFSVLQVFCKYSCKKRGCDGHVMLWLAVAEVVAVAHRSWAKLGHL